jgi:hypothetical protein
MARLSHVARFRVWPGCRLSLAFQSGRTLTDSVWGRQMNEPPCLSRYCVHVHHECGQKEQTEFVVFSRCVLRVSAILYPTRQACTLLVHTEVTDVLSKFGIYTVRVQKWTEVGQFFIALQPCTSQLNEVKSCYTRRTHTISTCHGTVKYSSHMSARWNWNPLPNHQKPFRCLRCEEML